MQALLLFLAAAAVIGTRGHEASAQVPNRVLLAMSIIVAVSLLSLRVV